MIRPRSWVALAFVAAALAWMQGDAAQAGEAARATRMPGVRASARGGAKDTLVVTAADGSVRIEMRTPPQCPPAARRRAEQESVYVRALVKQDGRTTRVAVVSGKGISPGLDRTAVEVVRGLAFVPPRYKGEPVAVDIVLPVRFVLR